MKQQPKDIDPRLKETMQRLEDTATRLEKELRAIHGSIIFVECMHFYNALVVHCDDPKILDTVADEFDGYTVIKRSVVKSQFQVC
jgi:hypothetical protein